MVARRRPACQSQSWKSELARAFTRPEELLSALGIDHPLSARARAAAAGYGLLVPRGFADLMEPGNLHDPLLRQVLPLGEELWEHPAFRRDPVGDRCSLKAPGLLQKYEGRALLLASGACALHCRYCFRRHFPSGGENALGGGTTAALERLAASPDIGEIILSGGDPLLLDDRKLGNLLRRLATIPHLRRLRLHTRLPIVLPARITPALCGVLSGGRLTPVVVVHANHPRELGREAGAALRRLRDAGIALLNQSVLLRGVNDQAEVLAQLSEALFEKGVLPYYLHLLDRVAGAVHFEVSEVEAVAIMDRLRTRLPGYLVPRLVREEVGRAYKTPVA